MNWITKFIKPKIKSLFKKGPLTMIRVAYGQHVNVKI